MTRKITALAQLIELLAEKGVTSTADLVIRTGYTDRAIRKAKAELECRNQGAGIGTIVLEPGFRPGTRVPEAEPEFRNQGSGLARAHKESPSEIDSTLKKDSLPLPPQPAEPSRERGEIKVDLDYITGPGFKIDLAAVDQIAFLSSMPREQARVIAEVHARDWVANGQRPQHPMALLKRHLQSDKNQSDINDARKAKATASADKPTETISQRVARLSAASKLKDQSNGHTRAVHRAPDGSLLQAAQ